MSKLYRVTGMSCAACSARVEKAVCAVEGVTSCAVSLLTNSMGVEGPASPEEIIAAVSAAGYGASLKNAGKTEEKFSVLEDKETPVLKKRLIASVGIHHKNLAVIDEIFGRLNVLIYYGERACRNVVCIKQVVCHEVDLAIINCGKSIIDTLAVRHDVLAEKLGYCEGVKVKGIKSIFTAETSEVHLTIVEGKVAAFFL